MSTTSTATPDNTSTGEGSPQPPKKMVELTDLGQVRDALVAAQEDAKRAIKLRDDLEAIIKSRMGDAEIGLVAGQPAFEYSKAERIILRTKQVREQYPDVARECEEIVPVRAFRLIKP
jgi:predicted phage-related endonuclease